MSICKKNESDDESYFMGGISNFIIAIANPSKMNLVISAKSLVSTWSFRCKVYIWVGLFLAVQIEEAKMCKLSLLDQGGLFLVKIPD